VVKVINTNHDEIKSYNIIQTYVVRVFWLAKYRQNLQTLYENVQFNAGVEFIDFLQE
jgi:hypothetical protein